MVFFFHIYSAYVERGTISNKKERTIAHIMLECRIKNGKE